MQLHRYDPPPNGKGVQQQQLDQITQWQGLSLSDLSMQEMAGCSIRRLHFTFMNIHVCTMTVEGGSSQPAMWETKNAAACSAGPPYHASLIWARHIYKQPAGYRILDLN